MNERIFQLAKQADILFYKEHIPDTNLACEVAEVTKEDLQRFSELLIRQCAELMPQDNLYKTVLKHFGIEK